MRQPFVSKRIRIWQAGIAGIAALALCATPPAGAFPEAVIPEQPPLADEILFPLETVPQHRMPITLEQVSQPSGPVVEEEPDVTVRLLGLPQGIPAIERTNPAQLRQGLKHSGRAFICQNFDEGKFRRLAFEAFDEHLNEMLAFLNEHSEQAAFNAQDKTLFVWLLSNSGTPYQIQVSLGRGFLGNRMKITLHTDADQDGHFDRQERIKSAEALATAIS